MVVNDLAEFWILTYNSKSQGFHLKVKRQTHVSRDESQDLNPVPMHTNSIVLVGLQTHLRIMEWNIDTVSGNNLQQNVLTA